MKNIASNEIDGHGVFTSGGDVGFVAGLVATILPMFVAPLFMDDVDAWTFPKSISTLLFGSSAAGRVLRSPGVIASLSPGTPDRSSAAIGI